MDKASPQESVIRVGDKTYHLVKREDGAGMQLVRAYPDDVLASDREAEVRRAAVATEHGGYRASPRAETPANVQQAVETRTQTILSHEVDPDTRAALNGEVGPPVNRGRR